MSQLNWTPQRNDFKQGGYPLKLREVLLPKNFQQYFRPD